MEIRTFLRANWDRVLAVTLVLAGVVILIVGWIGVSGTGLVAEQNPYLISAGLGGIGLLVVGCTTWLSSDLQDEWRRLDAIEERLEMLETAPPWSVEHPTVPSVLSAGAVPNEGVASETPTRESVPVPAASGNTTSARTRRSANSAGTASNGTTAGNRRSATRRSTPRGPLPQPEGS